MYIHKIRINQIIQIHSVSSNRKYLIAFQIWIFNSLILACTLPPREFKTYQGLFNFHSVFRFEGISWSLFPTVIVLSVPFCTGKVKILSMFPYFRLTGLVWLGKESGRLAREGMGKFSCPARASQAKGFPRRFQVAQPWSPGRDCTTHRTIGLHFISSEIMPVCGFQLYFKEKQRFSEKELI